MTAPPTEHDAGTIAESVAHVPGALVQPFVARIVGYRYAGFGPGVHMGLPSRHMTFVISFDEPLLLATMPDGTRTPSTFDACVSGFHTRPVEIHHDGNQHGMQLEVTPVGARALFGMPAAELAHEAVSLDALWGPLAGELHDRLSAAATWPARFPIVEHLLCRAIALRAERPAVSADLGMAWQRLLGTGGQIDVVSLAADAGWSRRHFTERFSKEFGFGPKAMARVIRFERSKTMLASAHRPRLATIAAACGYADQAHLNRDWHALAGSGPTAWMAAEQLPIVQDLDGAEGAP